MTTKASHNRRVERVMETVLGEKRMESHPTYSSCACKKTKYGMIHFHAATTPRRLPPRARTNDLFLKREFEASWRSLGLSRQCRIDRARRPCSQRPTASRSPRTAYRGHWPL